MHVYIQVNGNNAGNKITITVDEDYVDSSFILRAVKSSNDSILAEITIDVVGLY